MGWFMCTPLRITSVAQNNAKHSNMVEYNAHYMDGQYGLYYIVQCVL